MKIEVRKSHIHGLGVFALEDIPQNEIIENCPVILLNNDEIGFIDQTILYNYYFAWDNKNNAIVFGNGSFYNSSYQPNAQYIKDLSNNLLVIIAFKNIQKGEEITINYNGEPNCQEKVWFDL